MRIISKFHKIFGGRWAIMDRIWVHGSKENIMLEAMLKVEIFTMFIFILRKKMPSHGNGVKI